MKHGCRRVVVVSGCVVAGLVAGCGSERYRSNPRQLVTAGDFYDASRVAEPGAPGAVDVNAPGRAEPPAVITQTPEAASEGITDVVAAPSAPAVANAIGQPVGSPVLVDAKIGDVNGQPIFASTFFDVGAPTLEALGPGLAAKARQMPRDQWNGYAQQQIAERLDSFIRDELLRAEALSSLTPEQKQGFFAFIQNIQEDMRRESGGSREAMKRQIEEREGITADQWTSKREQRELITFQIAQKILKRVNVSWREIAQAYNGRFRDRFQHPPRFKYRLVTIPADAAADQARFAEELAKGRPFPELAADRTLNRYSPATGGLEEREVTGEVAAAELFPDPALNAAAKELEETRWAGPLPVGSSMAWVYLEEVERSRELYEAQREIENSLREQRFQEALGKYVQRLRGRASVTSIPEMRARLFQIAQERYQPAARP